MLYMPAAILAIEDESDRSFMITLFLNYRNDMFLAALRAVGDCQTAEDMVQDACVRIIEKLDTVRKINSCKLRSYIVSIVKNISVNYLVKCDRRNRYAFSTGDDSVFEAAADAEAVDDGLIRAADQQELRRALGQLPENERNLLRMKYMDELPDDAIAEILCIKTESVRCYLSRARAHLRELLRGGENA